MDDQNYSTCVAVAADTMETRPLLDFGAGYVQRSAHKLPRQGNEHPWKMGWNYSQDVKTFRKGKIVDDILEFK